MYPMLRYALVSSTLCILGTVPLNATDFDLSWHTFDGGGETYTTGGAFELGGTIGQPDASATVMTGGDFTLTGGFWTFEGDTIAGCPTPGLSGNYCAADIYPNNGDGVWDYEDDGDCIVNILDLGEMLANYRVPGQWTREDGDVYPVGAGDGEVNILDLGELLAQYRDDCN